MPLALRFSLLLLCACFSAAPLWAQAPPTTFFSEHFDAVTAPVLPPGWAARSGTWQTSTDAASPGSGGNNLVQAGLEAAQITSPPVDLSGAASASLRYVVRRTGTYARDSLRVTASADGGATFPVTVLETGAALPEETSSYAEVAAELPAVLIGAAQVVFRFEAGGGGSSSANIRLDDLAVTGTGTAVVPAERFGFAVAAGTALEESSPIEVPLSLALEQEAGLQGLQFSLTWGAGLHFVQVARGPAVADAAGWTLSVEAGDGQARVLLLGGDGHRLPPGRYDSLLVLQVGAGAIAPEAEQDVALSLSDVVGSLALETGDDAGLALSPAEHVLTLLRRTASFHAAPEALAFGRVAAGGSGELALRVSNPGGTRSLTIEEVVSSNPSYAVSPRSATVPPDGEQVFTVTFAPPEGAAGTQPAMLTFSHDGEGGPTAEVPVTGTAGGLRGDADGDGLVEVLDVVLAIDFILERAAPDDRARAAADLYPFPGGDARLDVRDLTVLAQAISRGRWPDGTLLPPPPVSGANTASENARAQVGLRSAHAQAAAAVVQFVAHEDGLALHLVHELPLRALQLELDVEGILSAPKVLFDPAQAEAVRVEAGFDAEARLVRILVFRADGGVIDPGRYPLVSLPRTGPAGTAAARYASAVGADRARIPVTVSGVQAAGGADPPPDRFVLESPYPNPMQAGGTLHVPTAFPGAAHVRLVVYDVLGRRVATLLDGPQEAGQTTFRWDGRSDEGRRVPSGLYLLRMQAGPAFAETRTVVVQ